MILLAFYLSTGVFYIALRATDSEVRLTLEDFRVPRDYAQLLAAVALWPILAVAIVLRRGRP